MAINKKKSLGMGYLKANVPAATEEWFRQKAEREGVTMQSLIAPVLNAVARGEIRNGFDLVSAPHGNAKIVRDADASSCYSKN